MRNNSTYQTSYVHNFNMYAYASASVVENNKVKFKKKIVHFFVFKFKIHNVNVYSFNLHIVTTYVDDLFTK